MLHTVEGIYHNGSIELTETPAAVGKSRVLVTFLESEIVPATVNADSSPAISDAVLRELLAEGFISHIPAHRHELSDDFEPVEIMGEPLSETVIRERG